MRRFLTILFLLPVCVSLLAQNLRIAEFKLLERDLTACMNPVNDINGKPCALVKIQTLDEVTKVEGSPIKVVPNGNETWAYFPSGQKLFRVLTRHHKPLFVDITGYEKRGLMSKATYVLDLESDLPPEILFGIAPAPSSQIQVPTDAPASTSENQSAKHAVIGVYDETRISEGYPGFAEKRRSVENAGALYEKEFSIMKDDLTKKYEEYESLSATSPRKDQLLKEITDLNEKIERFRNIAQEDLNKMWDPFQKEYTEKGMAAIAVMAAAQVLDSSHPSTEPRRLDADYVDITDDIVALLNGRYTLPFEISIGYYDTSRVVDSHPDVKSMQKELQDLSSVYESEFGRIRARFDRCYNEYQQMDESVPQSVKDRKIKEIQAINDEADKYRNDAAEALRVRQEELMRPFREKLESAISGISKERGLAHTQESVAARLYDSRIRYVDITNDLFALLNN